jgi:hypothetical protein
MGWIKDKERDREMNGWMHGWISGWIDVCVSLLMMKPSPTPEAHDQNLTQHPVRQLRSESPCVQCRSLRHFIQTCKFLRGLSN